jgi:hypothetical protein
MTTDVTVLESIYLARDDPRRLAITENWSRCRKHKNTQIYFHKTRIGNIDVFLLRFFFTALYGLKINLHIIFNPILDRSVSLEEVFTRMNDILFSFPVIKQG